MNSAIPSSIASPSAPAEPVSARSRPEPTSKVAKPTNRKPKPTYKRLTANHFAQLHAIWDADRRIPTVASRRAWANARGVNPDNVHGWWSRRAQKAKAMGIECSREAYDMEVGDVEPEAREEEDADLGKVKGHYRRHGTHIYALEWFTFDFDCRPLIERFSAWYVRGERRTTLVSIVFYACLDPVDGVAIIVPDVVSEHFARA
ncbi:hypothetical protein DFP72DRAFT_134905 [Ephemerocybe angulata]|uniref:Homeobox domain-containing protein n=1 Tax=Ephemerocybe angulata TaxID=980116 RepID=A0A8H6M904_9AGAR|nr:hypothetical protein DFP72DRAFT_134905 [Tulosesus angulatus]